MQGVEDAGGHLQTHGDWTIRPFWHTECPHTTCEASMRGLKREGVGGCRSFELKLYGAAMSTQSLHLALLGRQAQL